MYFTSSRVVDTVRTHISADDLSPGVVNTFGHYPLTYTPSESDICLQDHAIETASHALTTMIVSEEVGALYYTNERVLSCCSSVFASLGVVHNAIESSIGIIDINSHLHCEPVQCTHDVEDFQIVMPLQVVYAHNIVWGRDPYVPQSVLNSVIHTISVLDTSKITESSEQLYFTNERAVSATLPHIESLQSRSSLMLTEAVSEMQVHMDDGDARVLDEVGALLSASSIAMQNHLYNAQIYHDRHVNHDLHTQVEVIESTIDLSSPVLTSNLVDDISLPPTLNRPSTTPTGRPGRGRQPDRPTTFC
jgi:hypothetical protein